MINKRIIVTVAIALAVVVLFAELAYVFVERMMLPARPIPRAPRRDPRRAACTRRMRFAHLTLLAMATVITGCNGAELGSATPEVDELVVIADEPYGSHPLQRFDVYRRADMSAPAPTIV